LKVSDVTKFLFGFMAGVLLTLVVVAVVAGISG
jgi:hypothetical protein